MKKKNPLKMRGSGFILRGLLIAFFSTKSGGNYNMAIFFEMQPTDIGQCKPSASFHFLHKQVLANLLGNGDYLVFVKRYFHGTVIIKAFHHLKLSA